MERSSFDRLARAVGTPHSRRAVSVLLASLVAMTRSRQTPAAARKKHRKKHKKPSPGGTPPCTPQCAGCGGPDGCGGSCGCAGNAVCQDGACQACTVVCSGDVQACSDQLRNDLLLGGAVIACPGRYTGTFVIGNNVRFTGAGAGENPATNTILDAEQDGCVVTVDSTVDLVVLRGLRITGGANAGGEGGGVFMESGTLQIDDCAIVDNSARNGGGVHTAAALTMTGTTMTGNVASNGQGGAINVSLSSTDCTIVNSQVLRNHATSSGGGIAAFRTRVELQGTAVNENSAATRGGGLYLNRAVATLDRRSRITNNTATTTGGGVYAESDGVFNPGSASVTGNSPNNCGGFARC